MMERLVFKQFASWKNKRRRKPLLVAGVRQCGKTYLIKYFGETEFEDMAYFNFDGNDFYFWRTKYDAELDFITDYDPQGSHRPRQ